MSLESLHSSLGNADEAPVPVQATAPAPPEIDGAKVMMQLYKNLTLEAATRLSRKERIENDYSTTTLSYGEIEYEDFIEVR